MCSSISPPYRYSTVNPEKVCAGSGANNLWHPRSYTHLLPDRVKSAMKQSTGAPLALALLLLLHVVAHCQGMDHCVGDWDCSLNGACAGVIGSRSCLCHPPVRDPTSTRPSPRCVAHGTRTSCVDCAVGACA